MSSSRDIGEGLKHLLGSSGVLQAEIYEGDPWRIPPAFATDYDLLLVDLSQPETNSLHAIRQLRLHQPVLPILALGTYSEPEFARAIMQAGASAYLSIDSPGEMMQQMISSVCNS